MKTYTAHSEYTAKKNSVIDVIRISDLIDVKKYPVKDAWINVGGWQSWNPGFEVAPWKKQPSLTCHFIKGWNKYLVFPETEFKASKNIVLSQFVTYLRWDSFYLVLASTGNIYRTLPPVQFVIDRKENTVSIEICDKGNEWKRDDITAEIEIFTASSYFECRDKLADIFGTMHFDKISSLGKNPGGWESWYNHYSHINEKLILEDLESLTKTNNVISKGSYSSKIFQIDDGWEIALGDWDYRKDRFPNGLSPLVKKIEAEGYIPGLWIAPFIIDSRSQTAVSHPDWLLHDAKGKLVVAGYNPLWGKKGDFYCLDLSNDEVISYLNQLMEKIVNEWGFRYIKLDFLYGGMLFGDYQNKTATYKIYTRAIKTLTSRNQNKDGKPVSYLGCGVPFEASFKYLPLSRIGCDTLEHWENKILRLINWNGRNEAYLNLKDTLGHAMWNRTIFACDPDVLFVRSENCSLSHKEKILIAAVNSLFGSQLMYSDDPGKAGSEEEKLTEEILSLVNKYSSDDFGLEQISEDIFEIFNRDRNCRGKIDLKKKEFSIV